MNSVSFILSIGDSGGFKFSRSRKEIRLVLWYIAFIILTPEYDEWINEIIREQKRYEKAVNGYCKANGILSIDELKNL